MNYTKPEIVVLGSAAELITQSAKAAQAGDPTNTFNAPAYDLDE